MSAKRSREPTFHACTRLSSAVLSHILSFLDTRSLAINVFPVCKAFRAQSSNAKLYAQLTLACDTPTAERLLKLAGSHLRSLTLKFPLTLPLVARYASPAHLRVLHLPSMRMIGETVLAQFVRDWQARRSAFTGHALPSLDVTTTEGWWSTVIDVLKSLGVVFQADELTFRTDSFTMLSFAWGDCSECHRRRLVAPCSCVNKPSHCVCYPSLCSSFCREASCFAVVCRTGRLKSKFCRTHIACSA